MHCHFAKRKGGGGGGESHDVLELDTKYMYGVCDGSYNGMHGHYAVCACIRVHACILI